MKCKMLFLLSTVLFASCAVPKEAGMPTSSPQPSTIVPQAAGTSTLTVTPNALLGTVQGDFSWVQSGSTDSTIPIPEVTVQLDKHNGEYLKYKVKTDSNGHFVFANVEPGEYGFGIYMNLQLGERKCDAPEYIYSQDLGWQHYASWLKIDVFYDVIFSSTDITANPGEVVVLDVALKCP